jgi:hypothetical protein
MEIAALTRNAAAGALLEALELAPGMELAVRVHEAPASPGGGRGVISLAGMLVPARLPEGVAPGQRLLVRVVAGTHDEVTLRIQQDEEAAAAPGPGALARAAGALATSGDGELVQVAVALQPQGLALPLGNGDVLALSVPSAGEEEGDTDPEGSDESHGEAAFVLHSVALGPIAVRLRLAGDSASVHVAVEPEAEDLARAAADELRDGVERATGASTSVSIASRTPAEARPVPPPVASSLDAYA